MKTIIKNNIIILSAYMLLIGCGSKKENIAFDKDNGGLYLPDGFGAVVVIDSIGPSRHLAVKENGDIYVKLKITSDTPGSIALRDENGDGKADIIQPFGSYVNDGIFATGMRINNGYLYYSTEQVVYRQKLDDQLVPTSKQEIVLIDENAQWHIAKPLTFDHVGNMYVPYGAPSNACASYISTKGTSEQQAGQNPCPELINHAGIWKFKANALNQSQKDGTQLGTGLRSIVAMDWNKETNTLFATQHGRDDLHLLWPQFYSAWENAVTPAEEFFEIKESSNYGWPYSYYDLFKKQKLQAPEYGGDGKKLAIDQSYTNPLAAFPAHWAPNDLLFYTGNQFPDRYKNGAFIAFHGSTNRGPYPQAGYIVAFLPFENGKPKGEWEVFADGFAGMNTIVNTGDALARPMGIAMGQDGSLYISESVKGKIWRIMYKGKKSDFGEASLAKLEQRKNQRTNIKDPDRKLDNLETEMIETGSQVYNLHCGTCHQRDGEGDGSRFPPINNSRVVNGKNRPLIELILKGLEGAITVNGVAYNGVMPSHSFLSDAEISSVLTYIRRNFGNDSPSISAIEVGNVRKQLENQ